ncbi:MULTISPECIES: CDP-glycerol glycerophosphotransferase family protein [unclassified Shewanella]|uniref:CDP-glycerol glycerophosphotransferase family protein n=1 Tax=unclassified Shewanella TaxID=196818 RepID=UPI000CB99B91|nr:MULTISPECIES: CDP-glycerol glycerophosphotransferase family protein [unclassified Shewanella]MDO6775858.1 CDP-glycerol glycerophosphotransferase family protein [Shewanella sp. 3_MG-2023]PMG29787.1 hypothetical protein BCU94_12745 [Shewanella sp. 10N.286.52.C2]PMG42853.1 hypothetical protein BCU91_06915 [Shewanella sp. 10N.286.52.B9]PMI03479.1 hypothetical protein BCU55_00620 [Shewanella sp. 10N.286.48.A6]
MSQFIANSIKYVMTQSVYFLSGLTPRTRKAVMGCYKNKFADNSKYLFLHWQRTKTIRAIWISGDGDVISALNQQGYEAYHRWSAKGIYHALTAEFYFYTSYIGDINQYFAKGATKVNLWHGSPLKRIEYDINNGPLLTIYHPKSLSEKLNSASLYHQQKVKPDHMIAPSDLVANLFASAFNINLNQMLNCGNPRTDYYSHYPESNSLADELKQINHADSIILYAPSWRDASALAEKQSNPYLQAFDFELLSAYLVANKQLFLLRLHPNEAQLGNDISNYPNIINISDWQDTYEIINEVDLLITDYSSLYIDMLQSQADIVFYQFDQQQYSTDSRQCYDYAASIPAAGRVITEFSQLMAYLATSLDKNDASQQAEHKKNRAELSQLYWQYQHINVFDCLDEFVKAK